VIDLSKVVQQVAAAAAAAAVAAERSLNTGPKTVTAASTGAAGLQAVRQELQELTSLSGAASGMSGSCCPASAGELLPEAQSEGSGCVLSMQFVQFSGLLGNAADRFHVGGSQYHSSYCSRQQHVLLQELLQPPPQLLVCTRRGMLLVSVGSGEVERCCLFGLEAGRVQDMLQAAGEARSCLDSSSRR
jgi:hypothetical protein